MSNEASFIAEAPEKGRATSDDLQRASRLASWRIFSAGVDTILQDAEMSSNTKLVRLNALKSLIELCGPWPDLEQT